MADIFSIVREEGNYYTKAPDGEVFNIDVYIHPAKGLCVWAPDYGLSCIEFPISTDGDGHVPVEFTGLEFIKRN